MSVWVMLLFCVKAWKYRNLYYLFILSMLLGNEFRSMYNMTNHWIFQNTKCMKVRYSCCISLHRLVYDLSLSPQDTFCINTSFTLAILSCFVNGGTGYLGLRDIYIIYSIYSTQVCISDLHDVGEIRSTLGYS